MKTICIAGKNDIAVDVLLYCKEHYPRNRVVLVTNRNESGENSWQKSAKWFAKKNNIEILDLKDTYEIGDLLFLSCEFDRIVRPEKFKTNELYNIHFSFLPKYKGCFPSVLPILHGEASSGVTLHRIRTGIDTGEIIDQQIIEIDEKDSSFDLYKKLIKNGTEVVIRNVDMLLNGNVDDKPQNKVNSSYYPGNYIDYSTLSLNVNQTAFQIQNQIRAFAFRPYQLLKWSGVTYIDTEITNDVSTEKAGTILEETEVYTKIATIDYDIVLFKDTLRDAIELIRCGKDARHLCTSKKIIESQDSHGWSLLTVAVYNNKLEIVKWLVSQGADINVVNNNGTTLLMYAKNSFVSTGNATIFEYLYDLGLSPDLEDYNGLTLYDYCRKEGVKSIGKFVVKSRCQAVRHQKAGK